MSIEPMKATRRPAAANLVVSYAVPLALIVIWIAVLLGLPAYLPLQLSIYHFPTILWYNHHVILAFPPYVGQTFPFVHSFGSPFCPTGPSRKENLTRPNGLVHAGSLRSSSGHTARGRGFRNVLTSDQLAILDEIEAQQPQQ